MEAVSLRRRPRPSGASRLLPLVLALALGGTLGIWVVERYGDEANARLRIERMEQRLAQLRASFAQTLGAGAPRLAPSFSASCPQPWQVVGAIEGGLWGCRAPAPATKAFHPNCNVTRSWVAAGTEPEQYYVTAVAASAQLSAAKQLAGKTITVHGRPAYQASFEHRLLGSPMRVVATMFVAGQRAYALTCTAPERKFDTFAGQFLEIAASFEITS